MYGFYFPLPFFLFLYLPYDQFVRKPKGWKKGPGGGNSRFIKFFPAISDWMNNITPDFWEQSIDFA